MAEERKKALATAREVLMPEVINPEGGSLPAVRGEDGKLMPINPMEEGMANEMVKLVSKMGTLKLDREQRKILHAPPADDRIEVREDGLIYYPWEEYVFRLREAFGGEHSWVPIGMPKLSPERSSVLWGWWLMVQGKAVGFAIGEQAYHPNNPAMCWGDAIEGAKSNAKMRICKDLGICLELWNPTFVKTWIAKNAEQYRKPGKRQGDPDKLVWRRKDAEPEPEKKGKKKKDAPKKSEAKSTAPPTADTPKAAPPPKGVAEPPDIDEKDALVQAIKLKISRSFNPDKSPINEKDFKKFLLELQKRPKINTQFVGMMAGQPELHQGRIEDLRKLNQFFDWALKEYGKSLNKGK